MCFFFSFEDQKVALNFCMNVHIADVIADASGITVYDTTYYPTYNPHVWQMVINVNLCGLAMLFQILP